MTGAFAPTSSTSLAVSSSRIDAASEIAAAGGNGRGVRWESTVATAAHRILAEHVANDLVQKLLFFGFRQIAEGCVQSQRGASASWPETEWPGSMLPKGPHEPENPVHTLFWTTTTTTTMNVALYGQIDSPAFRVLL
jgi:hypothetical protein